MLQAEVPIKAEALHKEQLIPGDRLLSMPDSRGLADDKKVRKRMQQKGDPARRKPLFAVFSDLLIKVEKTQGYSKLRKSRENKSLTEFNKIYHFERFKYRRKKPNCNEGESDISTSYFNDWFLEEGFLEKYGLGCC